MQRLFEQFIPEHYAIHWNLTRIAKRHVSGSVQIKGVQVLEDTIRLHVNDLTIDAVTVNDEEIKEMYLEKDELIIPHKGAGEIYVTVEFSLKVTDSMHGIYPCYYTVDGARHELYATQFESHHAREAFPCIDEPEAKATFDISLTTADTTVLSNMPIRKQQRDKTSITTAFETSPRMSSYLVAFAVGDFQRATTKTTHGVEVNVYATKAHSAESLTWALEHAAKTIDFFDDYFGVPYPLPKSDHVALPDFSSGAMENWGLVTYREVALLADPRTVTLGGKEYISEVVAHELSHQWFGNLVTMKWWDNLWLNESFATVMEYLAADALHPDWKLWFDFVTSEGVMALRRDCIDGVQPVQVGVSHPDEINSLFDGAIVYAKGGRLLRMMHVWIGDEAFRAGLKSYFTTFAYANTTGDDLWRCLSYASGKDVVGLMNAWITQPGYPVVRASLEGDQLLLQQEQFFVGPHTATDRLWPIPLAGNDPKLPDIMAERSITVPFREEKTLYLNAEGNGHFITLYDETLRARIIADILAGRVSDIFRAEYLHEQTLLARGGYVSSASLIDLLVAYENETSEKVWDIMALAISDLKRFVESDQESETKLRMFVGRLAQAQFDRLGWDPIEGESEEDVKLRTLIIGFMVYSENDEVIAEAIRRFSENDLTSLNPELRGLLMNTAVRYGKDTDLVERLMDTYKTTSSVDLQSDISSAVTSSRDKRTLEKLIHLLTDTDTIRQQDTIRWYVNLLRSREGRTATWRWLRDKWGWVEEMFSSDKSHDYFPRYTANILSTRQQLDEYRAFFTPLRSNPALVRAIDMGVLDLEARVELLERDSIAVATALTQITR